MEHLVQAEDFMLEMSRLLPDADQGRFLENIPFNRQIRQALAMHSQQMEFKLVRTDVPLGKKLTDEDYAAVTWTISAPGDTRLTPESTRRQHILRRLLTEATAQRAAPTDDTLAQVLGVSRRTILRDIKVLQEQGMDIKTRQRGSSKQ